MMCLKKILTILVLSCLSQIGYGQINDTPDPSKIKKQIPTSPEASALGKYGDIPVGLYTGVPNIDIPLYVIKIKDFELPISLSYNSSGIKVEEMATNVGLGWALNAGGSMSVSINGLPDTDAGGMLYPISGDDVLPPYVLSSGNLAYNYNESGGGVPYIFAKKAAEGSIDTQPDLYQYSIPGASGKFYFDVDGQIHPVPFSAIKIVRVGLSSFKVIDEQGRVFNFKAGESSVMQNSCGLPVINNTAFLSDIQLPDGNSITFHYTQASYSYKIQRSFSRQRTVSGYPSYNFLDCQELGYNTVTINGLRLSGITSTAGHNVQMIYGNNRADLPGTQSLDRIICSNQQGLIKSYDFNYDYFVTPLSSSPDGRRLKLLSVTGLEGEKHSFEYNETTVVPDRLSFAQDHWGYFNGKSTNTTLLPAEEEYGFFEGANRNVDSVYSQMAILKQINYPTGGLTRFNYEQNDYFFSGEEVGYLPASHWVSGKDYETVTFSFTIPTGQDIVIGQVYYDDGSGPAPGRPPIDEPSDRNTTISISGNGFFQSYYNGLTQNGTKGIELHAGTYTISINSNSVANGAYCRVDYQNKVTNHVENNKLIGGLRIKNIVSKSSPDGISEIKKYQYREQAYADRSSGKINFYPLYTTSNMRYVLVKEGEIITGVLYTQNWKQTANSVYPTGSIKGGSVGYTFVSNYYGLNGENGKTESTLSFVHSSGGSLSNPQVPFIDNDWQNGMLKKVMQYRNNGGVYEPISELQNFYSVQPESVFWNSHYIPSTYDPNYLLRGRGVAIEFKVSEMLVGMLFTPAEFRLNDFRYISEWLRLDSSYTMNYEYAPSLSSVRKVKQLVYNNPAHLLPSIMKTWTSNGTFVQNVMLYPQDYPGGTSSALDSLIARNRINAIVKQELNNNSSISNTNYVYRNWDSKITDPEYVQTKTGDDALENRIQYYGYDDRANVLSVAQFKGVMTNYIWSYNKTLPIAEIKNIDYQVIVAALGGQTAIDAFANKPNPSKAEIDAFLAPIVGSSIFDYAHLSSYSYDPLVGMLTSTDPKGQLTFYEYDNSKRLRYIKDQDGNIIRHTQYHYKP